MKTKYLLTAALVASAFTACNDDYFVEPNIPNQEVSEMLSEDFVLNVSLGDGVESRANWAGKEDLKEGNWVNTSVFSNVYFEPDYDGDDIVLSNNVAIKGDQIGLCLIGSNKAIANIPFFIAGYESNARLKEGSTDPLQIFPIADQDAEGELYYVGKAESTAGKTKIDYTSGLAVQTVADLNTAQGKLTRGFAQDVNDKNGVDLSKGLFKCHIPVMSGTYFTYFPFDKTLLTQGNIPVPTLKAFEDQSAAINKDHVKNNMFAYSTKMQTFDHTKVSGQLSMDANAAVIFQVKLQNHAETAPDDVTVKLVTVTVDGDEDAFVLDGAIGFDGTTAKFVEGTKTSSLMGVSLNGETGVVIAGEANAQPATSAIAYIATYPKSDAAGSIVIRAYTTDGNVYERKLGANISSYRPGSNQAPTITLNLGATPSKKAELLVYNNDSFESALKGGNATSVTTIKLMGDVVLTDEDVFDNGLNYKFKVVDGSLTFKGDAAISIDDVPAEITFECPVVNENANITIGEGKKVAFNAGLTNKKTITVTGAKANVTATTVTNNGTLSVAGTSGEGYTASFTATTITNIGTVTAGNFSVLSATTINNNKTTDATGTFNVDCALGSAAAYTINNNGILNWSAGDMNDKLTLVNGGELNIDNTIALKGASVTNNDEINVDSRWNVNSGNLINNGIITNNGNIAIQKTASVTNNKTIKDDVSTTMSGMHFVTNSGSEAQIIKLVDTAAAFAEANAGVGYTTIETAAALADINVATVEKNLIVKHNISFAATTVVNSTPVDVETIAKNIVVNANANLGTNAVGLKCANIDITPTTAGVAVTLTIAEDAVVKVTGNITTNTYYKADADPKTTYSDFVISDGAKVRATDIVTNGIDWTSYPVYGITVE